MVEISESQKGSAMKIGKIAGIIVMVLFVLYIIAYIVKQYRKYRKSFKFLIKNPRDATKKLVIKQSKLPDFDNGYEYTYSFWIFINDWEYRYGTPKPILFKGDSNGTQANPSIWLYPKENKLMVRFQTYSYGNSKLNMEEMNPLKDPRILESNQICDIDNIPLQKWVHVTVILWNRTSDVYIDGKLVRSCILPGVPQLNKGKIYVTPFNGFRGNISKLLVINKALNPDAVYKEYLKGPFYSSLWNSTLGKLNIGISVKSGDKKWSADSK